MLRIIPLGGLGHIGGNTLALESDDDLVLVDCGLLFPSEDQPGVDYVIPDLGYVLERREKLRGILLTHGHEDHLGAIPYLWRELRAPVYGTRFTLGLLGAKLAEFPEVDPTRRLLEDGVPVRVGGFRVHPIPVTHSIPGAVALAFETEVGTIVHSGDFKLDPAPLDGRSTDLAALRALGDGGVTLLMSDSTNAEKPGHTYGEAVVAGTLRELIATAPFRVVVTAFSSNLFRLRSIIEASEAVGRKVVLAGRSVEQNVQLGIEQGLLQVRRDTLRTPADFDALPRSAITVIAGGSQGEPQSALSRIAMGQHGEIALEPRDRVIFSSRRIPGNERPVSAVVNNLYRLGLEVVDDHVGPVHASGHAFNDEQRTLLEACRPRFFLPVHGEYRHLFRHAALARDCGVAPANTFVVEDGQPLLFERGAGGVEARLGEPVHAGFVYVDGKGVGDVGEVVLRDRRVLAETGIVLVVATLDETGHVLAGPDVITRGVLQVGDEDSRELIARAELEARDALEALEPHADHATRSEEVRVVVRRLFRRELDRRPLVIPVLMTI
jgi:ribonuclease J